MNHPVLNVISGEDLFWLHAPHELRLLGPCDCRHRLLRAGLAQDAAHLQRSHAGTAGLLLDHARVAKVCLSSVS